MIKKIVLLFITAVLMTTVIDFSIGILGGTSHIWSNKYVYDVKYCNGPDPGFDLRCAPPYQVCRFFICKRFNNEDDYLISK